MSKSTIQYTIRGVPPATDRRLRKLAKISGKSLNEVIIDEISEKDKPDKTGHELIDSLDWFYGSNTIDDETIKFLEEEDKIQKELTRKQWAEDDN